MNKGNLDKRHSIFTTNSIYNNGCLNLNNLANLNKSDNCKQNASNTSNSKIKLRSNSIFAFNNNDKYSNIFSFEQENPADLSDLFSHGGISNVNANNNFLNAMNISNFLSNLGGDKHSQDGSFCTISSGMEKNLDELIDFPVDEMNDAKLDLRFKSENITGISGIKLPIAGKQEISLGQNNTFNNDKSGSSEKSEKYDEVDEFSLNNDMKVNKDRLGKRLSIGSGSLTTHCTNNPHLERLIKIKLGNLHNANNYEYDINRSINSMDFSASHHSSTSPNVSHSPTKNRSFINNIAGDYNSGSKVKNVEEGIGGNGNVIYLSPVHRFINPPVNQQRRNSNTNINSNFFFQGMLNNNLNNQPVQIQQPFSLTLNHPFVHPNSINTSMSMENTNLNNNHNNNNGYINQNQNLLQIQMQMQQNSNFLPKFAFTPTNNFQQRFNNYTAFNSPQNQSFNKNKSVNTSTDYKANKSSNNIYSNLLQEDNYVLENLLILLKDQNGCRMIQQKLKEKLNDFQFLYNFFEQIKHSLPDIVNDQFGNYVAQKFIEIVQNQGDKQLLGAFFDRLRNNLYTISINHYGTRFFQKALEYMTPVYSKIESDTLNGVLQQLIEEHIFDLILDTNGNHVFQKILLLYPKNKNQFIYDELTKIALKICQLKQGGCIFGRAFDCASPDQLKQIVSEILSHFQTLINDEYGNFIIQQIVFLKNNEFNELIFKAMKENIASLSKKKFSSNVIDKCILHDDPGNKNKLRNDIIDHMIENKLIGELICDQFGNYVIQKALQVSDGLKFMAIIHEIKAAVKTLKQTSNGRKIYENLTMQYGDYFHPQNSTNYKNINDGRRNSHMNTFTFQNKLEK